MSTFAFSHTETPSNRDYSNGQPAEIQIVTLETLKAQKGANLPSSACGPAMRLTRYL